MSKAERKAEVVDLKDRAAARQERLPVLKTYKLFIDGKFPRSESERYYALTSANGESIANVQLGSRKDFRNAVVAARKAFPGWAGRTAYNRGQILYRMAEMLEGRRAQFIEELETLGASRSEAETETAMAVDRLIYYAGWADKFQQVFSSVNPVASSHFNFSMLEPTGVAALLAPEDSGLLGLISVVAPAVAGGNSVVVLASHSKPLAAITFSEVLHTSDLPAGVINILTGTRKELLKHFASHMDVNALVYCGSDAEEIRTVQLEAAENLKRVVIEENSDWQSEERQSPYTILATQEVKTTWHPIGL
ncbi:MAG: aldehyde dehydrogenase family protein [Oligoflexia bacterium]|nr:aldehyde dehydrogenase family protein [Oligoflexia bacterium]